MMVRVRNYAVAGLAASLALVAHAAVAQEGHRTFSSGYRFVEMSGEEIYDNVCRGCHMADGKGATGAGSYPSLATNPNLEQAGYPVTLIIHGRRAMPPFGDMMNDAQIAAVVNYLRTHFGNNYSDVVTEQEVSEARQ
ncbi:MAG TPA: cytochrome c [Bradyrhizobium sp.]|uniref:c-type cytochrome n=1 Tax=Bradyrhizobium sp. TaxID=376 RepID=UPI002CF9D8A9|nr:cytochrome c [Bradyrhizobium sp.]HLZ05517.1 cytochrome c [Bradyrhizobium sp.]